MSAIAHWLELAGISTVVIGLVQLHLEKMRPPRALWVPFELGRPCGPPSDSEFQRNVLLQALQLVSESDKSTLQSFKTDDPRGKADGNWQPPKTQGSQNIVEETQALKTNYQRSCVRHSRTSFGVAKVPVPELAQLFDEVYEKRELISVREDVSPRLMFRLAIDDLKSYYIESALDGRHKPGSEQIESWLWQVTLLGQRMRELREVFIQSDDEKTSDFGAKFIVPLRWRD